MRARERGGGGPGALAPRAAAALRAGRARCPHHATHYTPARTLHAIWLAYLCETLYPTTVETTNSLLPNTAVCLCSYQLFHIGTLYNFDLLSVVKLLMFLSYVQDTYLIYLQQI